ncbi:hypothetical protein [Castellaniella caeni]|uniref:hypothetical protein n=1 Tax=Castellaniella caeni TaxID=266123 RepID=UPI0012EE67FF|nr:hypothetical protein [Castellaniella caeni]
MVWFLKNTWFGYSLLVFFLVVLLLLIFRACSRYQEEEKKTKSVDIRLGNNEMIQVWALTYQQSAESLRELARILASVNFAGLAGSVAVLVADKRVVVNIEFLYAAVIIFCVGLIFSVFPIASLSEKFRDNLSEIMNMLATNQACACDVRLHHTWPRGVSFFSTAIFIVLLGAGVTAFSFAFVGVHP